MVKYFLTLKRAERKTYHMYLCHQVHDTFLEICQKQILCQESNPRSLGQEASKMSVTF